MRRHFETTVEWLKEPKPTAEQVPTATETKHLFLQVPGRGTWVFRLQKQRSLPEAATTRVAGPCALQLVAKLRSTCETGIKNQRVKRAGCVPVLESALFREVFVCQGARLALINGLQLAPKDTHVYGILEPIVRKGNLQRETTRFKGFLA